MDLIHIRMKLDAITLERGAPGAREYLSMSQIGECPRVLYDQLVANAEQYTTRPTGREKLFALDKELKNGVREICSGAGISSLSVAKNSVRRIARLRGWKTNKEIARATLTPQWVVAAIRSAPVERTP